LCLATKGFSEYSGVGNEFKSNNFSGKINVNSNFKNSNVQVAVDYKFSRRRLEQNLFAFNGNGQPSNWFKITGKSTNKLKWVWVLIIKIQVLIPISYFLNGNVQYLVAKI
jgi:hypothetical protein